MVESNVSLREDSQEERDSLITPAEAAENVAFLSKQSESWLAVLFNVFSSTARESRGLVGEVISAWASIAGAQVRIYIIPFLSCAVVDMLCTGNLES